MFTKFSVLTESSVEISVYRVIKVNEELSVYQVIKVNEELSDYQVNKVNEGCQWIQFLPSDTIFTESPMVTEFQAA